MPGQPAIRVQRRVDAVERQVQREDHAFANQLGGGCDALSRLHVQQAEAVIVAENPPAAPAPSRRRGKVFVPGWRVPPSAIAPACQTSLMAVLPIGAPALPPFRPSAPLRMP